MPLLQFGEYKPDVSDYEAQATRNILNVVPRGDGYGPFPSLAKYVPALPAACRGAFRALNPDGSITVFASTATKLYRLNNTTLAWVDVSKGSTTYSALSADALWQFRQFNNLVLAVQQNVVAQVYDLTSSTTFDNLGGSPPQAAYVEIVGRFVVLSGLLSFPFRIQWSGLNAPTTWTSGVNSSDFQDFTDGGIVRGVAGGESGVIFQDQAIRRMSYVPGSPLIFQIDRIADGKGIVGPYSIVRAGELILFYSTQGFQKIAPGGFPEQIGRERVDRTFSGDVDAAIKSLFVGAANPRDSKVYWSYKSLSNNNAATFDRILGYDFILDRFFPAQVSGEFLFGSSQPGLTLESLDTISTSLDSLSLPFDSYSTATLTELAAFDSTHALSFFRGAPLAATLESGEQGTDRARVYVRGFRPITDAPTVSGSLSYRETVGSTSLGSPSVSRNTKTGRCDMLRSTRYVRYKASVPAGASWTYFAGVEPDVVEDGEL